MTAAIAFFPWLSLREAKTLGSVRLLPYQRGAQPGGSNGASQSDIDAILALYTDAQGRPINAATLLEFGSWQTGQDVHRHLRALFRVGDFLTFAALSQRELFRGHFGYCNSHCCQLIVQNFSPSNVRAVALRTRRRDGSTGILWSSDVPAFRRPLHVPDNAQVSIDEPLLLSLLRLSRAHPNLVEAIRDFNAANTDSPDIPEHTEVVMIKAALEWLYGIDEKVHSLVNALIDAVPAAKQKRGPLAAKWATRYKKPSETHLRPLVGWAREFSQLRNASAHGGNRRVHEPVWSTPAHLAFASLAFPLLMKQRLSGERLYALTERDTAMLGAIDRFILHDPMRRPASGEHPWHKIENSATLNLTIRQLAEILARE